MYSRIALNVLLVFAPTAVTQSAGTTLEKQPDERKTIMHFMGLEGVGHHAVLAAIDHMDGHYGWNKVKVMAPWKCKSGWPESGAKINAWYWKSLAKKAGRGLAISPLFSFPCGDKDRRTTAHPDVKSLLKAAAIMEMDVRVIVGIRDPYDTLRADCVHRVLGHSSLELGWCQSQAADLLVNAKFLVEQMKQLRRDQYMCAPYGDTKALTAALSWALRMDEGIVREHVNATWMKHEGDLKHVMRESLLDNTKGLVEELMEGVAQLAKTLKPAFGEIAAFCSPQQEASTAAEKPVLQLPSKRLMRKSSNHNVKPVRRFVLANHAAAHDAQNAEPPLQMPHGSVLSGRHASWTM